MDNQEEPTVSLYLTDETLQFLRPCFDYDAINRPKARYIEQQLVAASQMPTWTNIAFHKYYAHGNPATAAGKY